MNLLMMIMLNARYMLVGLLDDFHFLLKFIYRNKNPKLLTVIQEVKVDAYMGES